MSAYVVCSEMMCREFGEGWITSAALERMVLSLQKGHPVGEHAVNPLPTPGNFIGAVHGRRGTPGLTGDAPEVPW